MHVPPAFRIEPSLCLDFAAARGFGLVVACNDGRPVASSLPFHLALSAETAPRVAFHVARNNSLAALAAQGGTWLLAVQGHDTYVSPDWYESADQVPTWLYESVHLTGPVRVMDASDLRAHLDDLTAPFEARLAPKPPWKADKVALAHQTALMKAIVGIEMTVAAIEGSAKLNQHKADPDHRGVAVALAQQRGEAAQAIAARMIALRPHLEYGETEASRAGEAVGASLQANEV
jgi:transcriptional regulator